MKKTIKIFIFIAVLFILTTNVNAEEIISLGYIESIKLHLKTTNYENDFNFQIMSNNDTGEWVYSLNPKYYDDAGIFTKTSSYENLDNNFIKEISYILYCGYNNSTHSELNYYIATQYLIWNKYIKEIDNGEIYFIDENNNKIILYEDEINNINNDINKLLLKPSFIDENIELKINEKLILKDTNDVLPNYEVYINNIKQDVITGNNLNLEFNTAGTYKLEFKRIFDGNNKINYFYKGNATYLSRGLNENITSHMNIKVKNPSLRIKLNSNENYSFKDTNYGIYDNNNLISILKTNEKGEAYLNEIENGNYYLKELETSYGYKKNNEIINFAINSNDLLININKELDKKEYTIHKYINKDNEIIAIKNAKFNIYDEKNYLLDAIITDNYGIASILLPYGKFTIKEIDNDNNIPLSESFNIEINNSSTNNTILLENIDNNKNAGSLELHNLNNNCNIKYNLYSKDNDLIKKIEFNENNIFEINDIDIGEYYITNNINNNIINVKIKENIKSIVFLENRLKIDVPKTGINELIIAILISSIILLIGILLCNYGKNNK